MESRDHVATDPVVAGALASGDWRQVIDPATGKFYYHHVPSGRVTWDIVEATKEEENIAHPLVDEALASGEWRVVHPSTGRKYYHHVRTGVTTWELTPAAVQSARTVHSPPATPLPEDIPERVQSEDRDARPGTVEAKDALTAGVWEEDKDKEGRTFYVEKDSSRSIWDLRAEMAQRIAEQRALALSVEQMSYDASEELSPRPRQLSDQGSTGSGDAESRGAPNSPPREDEHKASGELDSPKESRAWTMDHASPEKSLSPVRQRNEPPWANETTAPDFSLASRPRPDPFTVGDQLREVSQQLDELSNGRVQTPKVTPSPRCSRYDARAKWGPVQYVTDDTTKAVTSKVAEVKEFYKTSTMRLMEMHEKCETALSTIRPYPEKPRHLDGPPGEVYRVPFAPEGHLNQFHETPLIEMYTAWAANTSTPSSIAQHQRPLHDAFASYPGNGSLPTFDPTSSFTKGIRLMPQGAPPLLPPSNDSVIVGPSYPSYG